MTGILSSIGDLFSSILHVIQSILETIFSGVEGVFALFGTAVKDVAGLARGLVDLILSMALVLFPAFPVCLFQSSLSYVQYSASLFCTIQFSQAFLRY
jgi:hypothetical protein